MTTEHTEQKNQYQCLSETQQYFTLCAMKLVQNTASHDSLLHQQPFDLKTLCECVPYFTGPFNYLSEYGQKSLIDDLIKNKLIRHVKDESYRFLSAEITNELISRLESDPIEIKNTFKDQFSFEKYKNDDISNQNYTYKNICFGANNGCSTTIYMLSFSLCNGVVKIVFVIRPPCFNQNLSSLTDRACGCLAVIVTIAYLKRMQLVDRFMRRIVTLLSNLPRRKCTQHSNCEQVIDTTDLKQLIQLLEGELSACNDDEYIKSKLIEFQEYLDAQHFIDQWDEGNSLAQLSSEMVENLLDKFVENNKIKLVNNPTQIQSSLKDAILHEEYDIIEGISKMLTSCNSSYPMIIQTCSEALNVTKKHFKGIQICDIEVKSNDNDSNDEYVFVGGILDFDTVMENVKCRDIFPTVELVFNAPFLNKSLLQYIEILNESTTIINKLINGTEEYNIRMAWEIQELLKDSVSSQWPRRTDTQLCLRYQSSEVREWFHDEYEALNIPKRFEDITPNNWKDFVFGIGVDQAVISKIFEVAVRSQWVSIMNVGNMFSDEILNQILNETIRNETLQLKAVLLSHLKKLAQSVRNNCPQKQLKSYLQTLTQFKDILSTQLYTEIAINVDTECDQQ
eukprot:519880_1